MKFQIDGIIFYSKAANLLLAEQGYYLRVGQAPIAAAKNTQHPGKGRYKDHHIDDHD
jgi:hypothetical protein